MPANIVGNDCSVAMINLDFEQIRSQMAIKASKAGKIVKFEEENRIVLAVVRSGWELNCKWDLSIIDLLKGASLSG